MRSTHVEFLRNTLSDTIKICNPLFRIMIPVIIAVKVLQEAGGISVLGNLLSPVMQLVGLPG
ncbi:MAG: hypothetical protein LLG06_12445, partial [Desulfobacteraceae bacterium]|nr:hypothetical protein [Desulfobacteraceae bacterium]